MANVLNLRKLKEMINNYSDNKKKQLLIVCLMIGILMMLLSSLMNGSNKKTYKNLENGFDVNEYQLELEKRLLNIVEKIEGVGKAKIMVTLENSVEYIYAKEIREKKDRVNDYQDKTPLKTQERNDEEQKLMLVDGPGGRRQALIKTEVQPKIKGVVVVCQGGDKPLVNQQVTNLITTILNISSNRVYVTKSFN